MFIAYITLNEIGQQISSFLRSIAIQVFDVLTPVLTTIGVIMIIFGVLALSAGREWLGFRLIAGGGILLIAIHFIIPMLLSYV